MVNIILAIMGNAVAQALYALSVNRVYGEKVIVIADKMKWWEFFFYGIYKHKTVDKAFVYGFTISCITITILTQFGNEPVTVALVHTILLTTLFLTDKFHRLLPNTLVFTALLVELLVQFSILTRQQFYMDLYMTGLVVFSFGLVYFICLRTGATMGGGDVKIAPFVTMYQGVFILIIMPISLILVTFYVIGKRNRTIPYGPFLITSILITIIFKPYVIVWFTQAVNNLYGG
jgi:Flp pilus assembly protein protease CpaA